MSPAELKEYKAGQRQGSTDYFVGWHKRFDNDKYCQGLFGRGYSQGFDLARAETNHKRKNEENNDNY